MDYYLHYVASGKSGIYGKEVFKKEAKEIGVNRSFPYFIVKQLKWGDKILLANFEARHAGEKLTFEELGESQKGKAGKSKTFQDGVAKVFGYYIVSGLNLTASSELKRRLYEQLDIVSTNNNPLCIKRSCGSYTLECSHRVTNSIEDIVNKTQKLSKELHEKVKYFVAGRFYELDSIIEGINFSRTVVKVELDNEFDIIKMPNSVEVGYLKDYSKRGYVPKKERVNV